MKTRLILFDIDGTMLDSGGAGLIALEEGLRNAFPRETGTRPFPSLDLGGATDGSALSLLLGTFGIPETAENRERYFCAYLERLIETLRESVETGRGHRKEGVLEMVEHLLGSSHHLGLLTGNIARAARLKLETFGYAAEVFPIGAFGCDHADRNCLGPIAMERAARTYRRTFDSAEVIIIGDTLKDIACARACGAAVAAVATGAHDHARLEAGEPDWLFEDLSDWKKAIDEMGL